MVKENLKVRPGPLATRRISQAGGSTGDVAVEASAGCPKSWRKEGPRGLRRVGG